MTKKNSPPLSPEAQENKLIALALKAVESDFMNGTASEQVKSHFIKLATIREQKEREKISLENDLLKARIESEKSTQKVEEMFDDVIAALKSYTVGGV